MSPELQELIGACPDPQPFGSWCNEDRLESWEDPPDSELERSRGHRADFPWERAPHLLRPKRAATDAWDRLPRELDHIRVVIAESRSLLELEPDADSPHTPPSEGTWKRAVEFLAKNAQWVLDSLGHIVDAPEILPGPHGSIDLDWDYPSYEVLINIPTDPQAKAGFYGDDRGEIAIKGAFDPSAFNVGLLLWLARTK